MSPRKASAADPTPSEDKVFYHLYVCVQEPCTKAKNPTPGAQHQRGLHTFSAVPLPLVKCPGCSVPMQIGKSIDVERKPRNPSDPSMGVEEVIHIDDVIYEVDVTQASAAELDEANLAKENEPKQ